MAEINFYDRAICITDVALVSSRRKLLIKFTHSGIPVAFTSRGERAYETPSCGYPGLGLDFWSIESGECVSEPPSSPSSASAGKMERGQKIVGKRSRQAEWLEWSTPRRSKATFRSSTFRYERCLEFRTPRENRKKKKKTTFPETLDP